MSSSEREAPPSGDDSTGEQAAAGETDDECRPRASIDRIFRSWGFQSNDLAFGQDINWNVSPDRGSGSFSDYPLRDRQSFRQFVNSGTPKANLVRQELVAGLRSAVNNGLLEQSTYDQHVGANGQIRSLDLWTPVQVMTSAALVGNASERDGSVIYNGDRQRNVRAGDILWVPVSRDSCEVLIRSVVRADCGNPGLERAVPPPEEERPPGEQPPGEQPPPEEERPQPKCFKDDGTPVFDGAFCGTPNSGPEQQPPEESDDTDTPNYEDGAAEEVDQTRQEECPGDREPTTYGCEVPDSQEGCEGCGGGEDSVISEPDDDADDNPDYDGSTPSDGTSEGTTNDADSDEADTPHDEETAEAGDPGGF